MIKLKKIRKNKASSNDYEETLKRAKEKEKAQKESKRKNKKNKRKKRKQKKVEFKGTEFAPSTGYTSTASMIKSGNRYGTIFKIVNTYGMNRNEQLGWAYNLIPQINVEGVKGYLLVESTPFESKEQSNHFKNIVPETHKAYETNELGNVYRAIDETNRKARIADLEIASVLDGYKNLALDIHIYVLIVGSNPDDIQEQVRKLNNLYNKRINGIKLMSIAGVQEEMFEKLLFPKEGSSLNYTQMSGLYAGFDHALRRGLNDIEGLPIGNLSDSYTKGQAFMAMNKTFKRRILMAAHTESQIKGFNKRKSSSSLWGQLVANNAMMYGHRVYHIVLNGHRYFGDADRTEYSCPPEINKRLQYIDLSQGGLNPFQMFGDEKRKKDTAYITNIFTNNIEKLYQIAYLASGRRLNDEKEDFKSLLEQFYTDSKVWNRDYPERSKVIGIEDPETVKTFGDFIRTLNNYQNKIRKQSTATDKDKDSAKNLYQTVKSALNTHTKLFNTVTTLPNHKDKSKLQWYYDVSNISNPDIREAQFLNAFDYCTFTASENDIVMIHGIDKVSVETLQVIKSSLDELSHRGVRLAYCFDTIGSGETKDKVMKANIFNTDGVLYQDFEQQFDYTILGTMSKSELAQYENKVRQNLNAEIENALVRQASMQYQIRRTGDLTSNIINPAEFIL